MSKSTQLSRLPILFPPSSAEQAGREQGPAFPVAQGTDSPASPSRPPSPAMMDAVVFEVDSASSPTSAAPVASCLLSVCWGDEARSSFPCGKRKVLQCSQQCWEWDEPSSPGG